MYYQRSDQSDPLWSDCFPIIYVFRPAEQMKIIPIIENYPLFCSGGIKAYGYSNARLKEYSAKARLDYVTNDGSMNRPFHAPPVFVNDFYHSEIKRSVGKDGVKNA